MLSVMCEVPAVFETKIMYEIIGKLHKIFPFPISICDASGRIMVSTDSASVGEMNLLAIRALNINARATASADHPLQTAGTAMPLKYQHSRIGAVVMEYAGLDCLTAELLSHTIELLYEELLLSQKQQNRTQEKDQFLYEWLHLQSDYTDSFIKRGELLGITITCPHTVLLIEQKPDPHLAFAPLCNLLDEQDILLALSRHRNLVILNSDDALDRKYHRLLASVSDCHTGICTGILHLHTAYQAALESLELGKLLFPEEHIHSCEKMKFAIALSKTEVPGLENDFAKLAVKGKTAQLAETAIAYIRFNGDIQKLCEQLHIHRNSIPYRLRRIQEICGRNLTDNYDLLCLYASFIRYMRLQGDLL